jgi:hypothetical protein
MTKDEKIIIASGHLLKNYKRKAKLEPVIQKYATDKLKMTGALAKVMANMVANGKAVDNFNYDDFLIWFYDNYVTAEPR